MNEMFVLFQSQFPVQLFWVLAVVLGCAVWDVTRVIKEVLLERMVAR